LRFTLIFKYSSSKSIPKNLLFNKLAAIPVVLAPVNGSKIHAPDSVEARIIRVKTESGFCVGYLPRKFQNLMPKICVKQDLILSKNDRIFDRKQL